MYVTEDGVNFTTLTTNGFNDPYNHGLRTFAVTNQGLCLGTANPFYGCQVSIQRKENSENPVDPGTPDADGTHRSFAAGWRRSAWRQPDGWQRPVEQHHDHRHDDR